MCQFKIIQILLISARVSSVEQRTSSMTGACEYEGYVFDLFTPSAIAMQHIVELKPYFKNAFSLSAVL